MKCVQMWMTVDPLADITVSPYAYVWNDPVNYADPSGLMGERKGGEKPGPKTIKDCFGGNADIGPGPKGRFGNLSWTRKFDQNTHINLGDAFVDHVAGRYGSLTA